MTQPLRQVSGCLFVLRKCGNSWLLTRIPIAAAAAKIKAQIQLRQGLQHSDSPAQRNVRQLLFPGMYGERVKVHGSAKYEYLFFYY